MQTTRMKKKFALLPFTYQNSLMLLLVFAGLKQFFPTIWYAEISAPWFVFIATFIGVHFMMAFAEFFFHRYVLHMNALRVFSHFFKQHNIHHRHTRVERHGVYAHNEYPIVQPSQYEASFFPPYTYPFFSACFTPFFVLVFIFFPSVPIFVAGYSGLMFSMVLYELIHAAWHWPLSTWHKLIEQKYFGRFWYIVYTFHLRHHANIRCNEAVSGFFGIPLPDMLFGTYVQAGTLYPHKRFVEALEFDPPTPIFLIRWLDKVCLKGIPVSD